MWLGGVTIGLPSYILNWEELGKMIQELLSSMSMKNIASMLGVPRIWGTAQSIPPIGGNYKIIEWTTDREIMLIGITYNQSAFNNEDYWEFWVDGDRQFETVYTREMGDQKHWEMVQKIPTGSVIKFILHNVSGTSKDVWVDLHYVDLEASLDIIQS